MAHLVLPGRPGTSRRPLPSFARLAGWPQPPVAAIYMLLACCPHASPLIPPLSSAPRLPPAAPKTHNTTRIPLSPYTSLLATSTPAGPAGGAEADPVLREGAGRVLHHCAPGGSPALQHAGAGPGRGGARWGGAGGAGLQGWEAVGRQVLGVGGADGARWARRLGAGRGRKGIPCSGAAALPRAGKCPLTLPWDAPVMPPPACPSGPTQHPVPSALPPPSLARRVICYIALFVTPLPFFAHPASLLTPLHFTPLRIPLFLSPAR